jgi:hypothetical protein
VLLVLQCFIGWLASHSSTAFRLLRTALIAEMQQEPLDMALGLGIVRLGG